MAKPKFRDRIRRNSIRIFLILILLFPFLSFAWWYFTEEKPLNLLIIDKTVLNEQGNEHRSFNWVLKHYKYTKDDESFFEVESDYKGFFPLDSLQFYVDDLRKYSNSQIDSLSDTLDALYITDTYGMYYNEWYLHKNLTEHSPLIYGKLDHKDVDLMDSMKVQNKLIITEFNLMASPTEHSVRSRIKNNYGLNWSGWTGRYFYSLDTTRNPELPKWVVRLYQKQYREGWPFHRSGLVFVHESEKIVVLDEKLDLEFEVPVINTRKYYQDYFDVPAFMRYPFWFDITYADEEEDIIAQYKVHVNYRGDSIMEHFGLPNTFPAVIGDHTENRFYYFCGDFADNPINMFSVYARGIEWFDFFFYNNRDYADRKKFFWRYYRPMIYKIVKTYYNELQHENKMKQIEYEKEKKALASNN